MYTRLTILYLLAISTVMASKDIVGCLSEPCRKHLGVYHITLTDSFNITIYEIFTFHADGNFNGVSSLQDGDSSVNPSFPAYSNFEGVWKCDGSNKIIVDVFLFSYPIPVSPRNLVNGIHKMQFNGYGRTSRILCATAYDLASTTNLDRSKWASISESNYDIKGYKLFDLCDL